MTNEKSELDRLGIVPKCGQTPFEAVVEELDRARKSRVNFDDIRESVHRAQDRLKQSMRSVETARRRLDQAGEDMCKACTVIYEEQPQ